MKITVTQRDIDKGSQADAAYCPVALALRRETGEKCLVASTICMIGEKIDNVSLPSEVQAFIADFDCGLPVKPFSFDLDF